MFVKRLKMNKEKTNEIVKIIINAILAIVTALCASACTVAALGRVPFS